MGYCFVCKALGDSNGLFRLPQKEAKRKNWVDALQKGYTSPLQTSKKDLRDWKRNHIHGKFIEWI